MGIFRNNVLAVGHVADEPLLFAPAAPFLFQDDGGALVVTCGVRREHARGALDVLWSETSHLAQRMLNDVHLLADAYGWPEASILAMSAQRRQFYIERVAQ